MSAAERLTGIKRTLDTLAPVTASLEAIKVPDGHDPRLGWDPLAFKTEATSRLASLQSILTEWADYEQAKLS